MAGQFIAYIDQAVNALVQEEKDLAASDRKDESNLVKIRINVYGICKSIYGVFSNMTGNRGWKSDYLQKLENMEQSWKSSYIKAKEHDDVKKAVIEEIKLQTLAEVKNKFMMTEGN